MEIVPHRLNGLKTWPLWLAMWIWEAMEPPGSGVYLEKMS